MSPVSCAPHAWLHGSGELESEHRNTLRGRGLRDRLPYDKRNDSS